MNERGMTMWRDVQKIEGLISFGMESPNAESYVMWGRALLEPLAEAIHERDESQIDLMVATDEFLKVTRDHFLESRIGHAVGSFFGGNPTEAGGKAAEAINSGKWDPFDNSDVDADLLEHALWWPPDVQQKRLVNRAGCMYTVVVYDAAGDQHRVEVTSRRMTSDDSIGMTLEGLSPLDTRSVVAAMAKAKEGFGSDASVEEVQLDGETVWRPWNVYPIAQQGGVHRLQNEKRRGGLPRI